MKLDVLITKDYNFFLSRIYFTSKVTNQKEYLILHLSRFILLS